MQVIGARRDHGLFAAGSPPDHAHGTTRRLAVALAQDPERLMQIRTKIQISRTTTPLFDTRRLCRELEQAYGTMVDIWQRGETPRSFSVESV
jgi:hypothetical protein